MAIRTIKPATNGNHRETNTIVRAAPLPDAAPLEALADGDQSTTPAPALAAPPATKSDGVAPPNEGRGPGGKFAAGNKIARGNPFARRQTALRTALLEAVSEDRLRSIVGKLADLAEAGDVAAAKLLLAYVVGRPTEAPDPDGVDAEEWRRLTDMPDWPDVRELIISRVPTERAAAVVKEMADQMGAWFTIRMTGHAKNSEEQQEDEQRRKEACRLRMTGSAVASQQQRDTAEGS